MNLMFIFIVTIVAYLLFRSFSKPKAIDVSFLPQQFIVVDVETTGLDSAKHKIIEIGAIKVNRDSIHHDSFQAYIKIDGKLPGKITEITGITKETLDQEGEKRVSCHRKGGKDFTDLTKRDSSQHIIPRESAVHEYLRSSTSRKGEEESRAERIV